MAIKLFPVLILFPPKERILMVCTLYFISNCLQFTCRTVAFLGSSDAVKLLACRQYTQINDTKLCDIFRRISKDGNKVESCNYRNFIV